MKKLIYSALTLLTLSLIIAGCSGETYEKKLKKEKRAINNYIADNNIKVIHSYPADHIFGDNEYYLEGATGVYIRVVKPGNLDDALTKEDEGLDVRIRFDSVYFLVKEQNVVGNNNNVSGPMTFSYGVPSTYMGGSNADNFSSTFMSPACVLPLEKGVGNGAVVDLIVPFLNGSTYQKNYYEPMKFSGMIYSFHKQETEVKP